MISILGDYNYTFPKPIPLKLKLKDLLEDNVDEKYYLSDKQIENIVPYGTYYTWNDLQGNINTQCCRAADEDRNALTVACANTGNVLIKNATKKGYLEATDGDGVDISSRMEHHRGTVQKEKTQTLTTMGGENNGVVVSGLINKNIENAIKQNNKKIVNMMCNDLIENNKIKENDIIQKNNITPTLTTSATEIGVCVNEPKIIDDRDLGLNGINITNVCPTQRASRNGLKVLQNDLRIRKLTPRECFRLMGVRDEDFEKCAKNQSDNSLYHLAGDSIVVNVLMAIFKEIIF